MQREGFRRGGVCCIYSNAAVSSSKEGQAAVKRHNSELFANCEHLNLTAHEGKRSRRIGIVDLHCSRVICCALSAIQTTFTTAKRKVCTYARIVNSFFYRKRESNPEKCF